jgi:hypothetical protein
VDVYNGGSTPGLAAGVSRALVALGYQAGFVGDAPQSQTVTAGAQVLYGAGASANAAKIAADFGVTDASLASLRAGHVEIVLGTGSTAVPTSLTSAASAASASSSPAPSPSSSPASTSAADNGQVGGAVTVGAKAQYGIPCVY